MRDPAARAAHAGRFSKILVSLAALALLLSLALVSSCGPGEKAKSPNLAKQPTLYVVGYAHLDTQWRWDYATTIRDYVTKTMRVNFDYLEKYPNYIFNFSGARRYLLMKEYFPAEYEKVKAYVAAGRWFPCGSSFEENDVNSPSGESIIRQVLYGTRIFTTEFGKTSAEYMLPDCFGFPASLPSLLAHCGIKGFSTQKLSSAWQPAALVGGPDSPEKTPVGIPFNVGVWEGTDGNSVITALNPGSYGGQITYDLSKTPPPPPQAAEGQQPRRPLVDWPARIDLNGKVSGVYADFMYYGTGDTGGAAQESSVKLLDAIVSQGTTALPDPYAQRGRPGFGQAPAQPAEPRPAVKVGDGPVKVLSATAEQMFLDIKPERLAKLPRYKGDLELINHSAGSLTSQAYMKRWNRMNEVLADGAERASVAAAWLGGQPYPQERLNRAWGLVLASQMHDIIPGTSIPKAYEYSWNDEVLAANQFAGVLTGAVGTVASALDTRAEGVPIVVYNPLNIAREDIVEATIDFSGTGVAGGSPKAVRVFGPDGAEVPAQLQAGNKVVFMAKVRAVGFAVYDVRPAADAPADAPASSPAASALKITSSSLENERYALKIDTNGDISAIFDKKTGKELLSAPARLEIKTDNPKQWPAWNMDYDQQMAPPRAYVGGPAKIRIVENGPARVALEIGRKTEGSTFVQTIRLAAGDAGNRIEIGLAMDWMTKGSHLKAVFPLTASNPTATYNWDVGTIERKTNYDRQFEVASHQWVDLTDKSGFHGATLLADCKNASDKPDDSTLRLTLVRTPGTQGGYPDQGTQDLGHHELVYGLAGHGGDFRRDGTDWQGFRLNQPLAAFIAAGNGHEGPLGKSFSMLSVSHDRVRVLALKKAEQGDEIVLRLVEMDGREAPNVKTEFAGPVLAAREITGTEEVVGKAKIAYGMLEVDLKPFQVRSFAVKIGQAPAAVAAPISRPIDLPYDLAAASSDGTPAAPGFDSAGRSLPAEMLPPEIAWNRISFKLGPAQGPNALVARGQTISLPQGKFNRLYILAASADGDRKAAFKFGEKSFDLTIQDWGGYIGQWDNRLWNIRQEPVPPRPEAKGAPATPASTPQIKQAQAPPQTRPSQTQAASTSPSQGAPSAKPQQPRMRTVMDYIGLTPGFTKPAPVAWFASHRHLADGTNDLYAYAYIFVYAIDLPEGAASLTLPSDDKIRVLAVTLADQAPPVVPAQPLFDTLVRAPKK
jgi:alpha-mannosidase